MVDPQLMLAQGAYAKLPTQVQEIVLTLAEDSIKVELGTPEGRVKV